MIFSAVKALILSFLIGCASIAAGYFIYCAIILIWSPPKILQPHQAIVVLTGAKGRIETGFELLLDDKAPQLYISGVLERVSLDELIQTNAENLSRDQIKTLKNHCCITLDYVADTTETNAIETAKWVDKNNINDFILVTSGSHMPRAYILFHRLIDENTKFTAYPYNAQRRISLVTGQEFWQYAFREYTKFIGNLIRLERQ